MSGVCFGVVPWCWYLLPVYLNDPKYLVGYFIGLVCIFGMCLCVKNLPKRNKYGNDMYSKINGFRNYIKTIDKNELAKMVEHDSSYFYKVLPYAYALGVSESWFKHFESIPIQAPVWYDGSGEFNATAFKEFMNSAMKVFERDITLSRDRD